MKNLYRRLRLGTSATSAEIRNAIRSCKDAETAQDAEEILLSPERRAAYDRAFRTLHRIAPIREALGLTHAPHWTPHDRTEFPLPRYKQAPTIRRPEETPQTDSGCGAGCFVVIVLAVIAIVIASRCDDSSSRRARSAPPRPPGGITANQAPGTAPTTRPDSTWDPPAPRMDRAALFALNRLAGRGATTEEVDAAAARLRDGAGVTRPTTRVITQSQRGSVPVTVKTSLGSDYFVKFIRGGTTVAQGYIRGGASLTVNLPAGGYDVRYASGATWFGPELDFGPDASYARCDRTLQFQNGYEHTIELIRQINGNLGTRPMPAEDF